MQCKRILTTDSGGLMLAVDPAGLASKVKEASRSDADRARVVNEMQAASMKMGQEAAAAGRAAGAAGQKAGTTILMAEKAYASGDISYARRLMAEGAAASRTELDQHVKAMSKSAMSSKAQKVATALKGYSRNSRTLGGMDSLGLQGAMDEAVRADTISVKLPPEAVSRAQRFGVDIAGQGWIDKDARKVGGGTPFVPGTPGIPRGFNPQERYDRPVGIRAASNTYAQKQQVIGARLAGLGDAAQFNTSLNNIFNQIGSKGYTKGSPVITGNTDADWWINIAQQLPAIMNGIGEAGNFFDKLARDACLAGFPVPNGELICDKNQRIKFMSDLFVARFNVQPKAGIFDTAAARFISKGSMRKIVDSLPPPADMPPPPGGNLLDKVPGGKNVALLLGLGLFGGFVAIRKK